MLRFAEQSFIAGMAIRARLQWASGPMLTCPLLFFLVPRISSAVDELALADGCVSARCAVLMLRSVSATTELLKHYRWRISCPQIPSAGER
jgi:hypothetical protein